MVKSEILYKLNKNTLSQLGILYTLILMNNFALAQHQNDFTSKIQQLANVKSVVGLDYKLLDLYKNISYKSDDRNSSYDWAFKDDKYSGLEIKYVQYKYSFFYSSSRRNHVEKMLKDYIEKLSIALPDFFIIPKESNTVFSEGYSIVPKSNPDYPNIVFILEKSFSYRDNYASFDFCILIAKQLITPQLNALVSLECRNKNDNLICRFNADNFVINYYDLKNFETGKVDNDYDTRTYGVNIFIDYEKVKNLDSLILIVYNSDGYSLKKIFYLKDISKINLCTKFDYDNYFVKTNCQDNNKILELSGHIRNLVPHKINIIKDSNLGKIVEFIPPSRSNNSFLLKFNYNILKEYGPKLHLIAEGNKNDTYSFDLDVQDIEKKLSTEDKVRQCNVYDTTSIECYNHDCGISLNENPLAFFDCLSDRYQAFIIVSDSSVYNGANFSLPGADEAATDLINILTGSYQFKHENVKLINNPTLQQFNSLLLDIKSNSTNEGLIFYYLGHGDAKGNILLKDGLQSKDALLTHFYKNKTSNIKDALLIFDACYGGIGLSNVRSKAVDLNRQSICDQSSRSILTSSNNTPTANLNFTKAFVNALTKKGKVVDTTYQFISIDNIMAYMKANFSGCYYDFDISNKSYFFFASKVNFNK